MKEFKEYEGPFIHTKETYKKIMFSYIITFTPFFVYNFYINGIIKWQETKNISDLLYPLIFTFLPLLLVLIFETIYKLIFVKNQTFRNYLKENFSIFSILFFPFLLKINTPLYIIILSVIIGYLLYKILFKKWYSLTILSYLIYLILGLLNPNYLEILKILPINFNLKTDFEKEQILNSYKIFLKTCNFDIQILIQSKKEDLTNHIEKIKLNSQNENNKFINNYLNDYINYIKEKNNLNKSASKNFYLIIKNKTENNEENIIQELNEKYFKIKDNLLRCGNLIFECDKNEIKKILFSFFNTKIFLEK